MVKAAELSEQIRNLMVIARLDPANSKDFEVTSNVIYSKHGIMRTTSLDAEILHILMTVWNRAPWRVTG